MKMIRKIYLNDLKNLLRSFFVLVIIGGVCILPALYAWLNIYSNWDPYGNTQNITLAAVSEDTDYVTKDGVKSNVGNQILSSLKENKKIHWVFPTGKDAAIKGVRSGKYYGALVVPKDFTYSMYNVFIEDVSRPSITFYQNQKKNPVANKITDTVAETVLTNVNNQFIEVMTQTVFKDANSFANDLKAQGGVDSIIEKMEDMNQSLKDYETMIDRVIQSNQTLNNALKSADRDVEEKAAQADQESSNLKDSAGSINSTEVTLNQYNAEVNATLNDIKTRLNRMSQTLSSSDLPDDMDKLAKDTRTAYNDTSKIITDLTALGAPASTSGDIPEIVNTLIDQAKSLQNTILNIDQIANINADLTKEMDKVVDNAGSETEKALTSVTDGLDKAIKAINTIQGQYNDSLVPLINQSLDSTSQALLQASNLMSSMSDTLAGMGNVFGALEMTASASDNSLTNTKDVLDALSERLTTTIDKVTNAKEDEKVKILMDTLTGDPDRYAAYFSSPVNITSNAVYPVENYGSSVTPFYTALAIWVGALILTAVMKARPDKKKYPGSTSAQRFFGRFLTFLTLAELQTLVTVLGNLYLFKIQCLHPFYYWLACAIAAFTFTILIYSLVVAFHDVGKAIAVVLVVIQIAGSSGTYPIEVLPEFFRKVYIFFPFPYAINAMRETIGGMYGHDYAFYLMQLSVFILVALGIGLLVQKPLHELSHFMEKRMHDTEMM